MIRSLKFLFIVIIFSSCVPSKDLVYLQGDPVQKTEIHKINNEPYKLQISDVVSINIKAPDEKLVALFKKTEGTSSSQQPTDGGYFSGYTVDNHGNIRLPYLGEINVLGFTTKEVRVKLEERLKGMFKNPDDVFVTVKLAGIKYTVIGEVANPGPKVIYQNQVSIIDAISNAGDISVTGNRKQIEIYRGYLNNDVEKFSIDLTNVDAFNSEIFYIKPNDIINVLPLKQKAWGTGTTGLSSLTTILSVFTLVTSTILLVRGL
ncbi:polysaccharide biosynthesis/export family protein [Tenacibaculum sp. 1_MG-2023]|uniref:polysaccharide biosynthesis/export family protein n=1 Tax=Tenacibaculum sp. 1_MG-2023 TaxID=3062653 RepID=UPI0026E2E035|nr:polysaccharide biosynthesis/export family protein [Tenacibaculum sp. 1_MG-2023]MDO6599989.1 polysaccharide biosynthesis/export family protein [Tenacibaculum sp. 1_MG-2023]